jgi:hypothetical protein
LCLRLSSSASNGPTPERLGFGVSEIELAHTPSGIGEGDANGGASPFWNFLSRFVRDANHLSGHGLPPLL